MRQLQHILVGVTLDEEHNGPTRVSARAAQQAWRLALGSGARLTVVHASEAPSATTGGVLLGNIDPPALPRALEPLLSDLRRGGVRADLVIRHAPAAEVLLGEAEERAVDLVVVGRRERRGVAGERTGRTTHALLERCPVPVWVVHPHHALLEGRVLVAADGTRASRPLLRLAAELAAGAGAELHVVHALELPGPLREAFLERSARRTREVVLDREASARAELAADLPEDPAPEPVLHVRPGAVFPAVLEVAEELDPDVVVVGALSRDRLAARWVGGTAEQLAARLPCSLVGVKPEGFRLPASAEAEGVTHAGPWRGEG
jgi:nucleotide-binding universal stress UspA family protein